jgi:hypothetical protein
MSESFIEHWRQVAEFDYPALQAENGRLREALRDNVGEAYNLITQGESPTQRRQPSAQRIYDRSKQALAESKAAPVMEATTEEVDA